MASPFGALRRTDPFRGRLNLLCAVVQRRTDSRRGPLTLQSLSRGDTSTGNVVRQAAVVDSLLRPASQRKGRGASNSALAGVVLGPGTISLVLYHAGRARRPIRPWLVLWERTAGRSAGMQLCAQIRGSE